MAVTERMTRGQSMRRARSAAGFSDPAKFARLMGVEMAALIAWEADIESPTDEHLQRFAQLAGIEPSGLVPGDAPQRSQGICRAVDLVPDAGQAEALEQVGMPRALWRDSETWLGFLRLAQAVADLNAAQITMLAENAESCVTRPSPGSG